MLNLSFKHYVWVEAILKLSILHLYSGQADGIVDGAGMQSKEVSFGTTPMPVSLKFIWLPGEFRHTHLTIVAAGRSCFFLELQGMAVLTPVVHPSKFIIAIM